MPNGTSNSCLKDERPYAGRQAVIWWYDITISDILSFHATPVNIANATSSATAGEVADTALAAANAVQSFGAIMSKTLGNLAPPLLAANLINDGANMRKDLHRWDGKYSDATLVSAASNVTAALAYLGSAAALAAIGPATAIAVAAVGITAAAALGVASLSQNKHSTVYHDRINPDSRQSDGPWRRLGQRRR